MRDGYLCAQAHREAATVAVGVGQGAAGAALRRLNKSDFNRIATFLAKLSGGCAGGGRVAYRAWFISWVERHMLPPLETEEG